MWISGLEWPRMACKSGANPGNSSGIVLASFDEDIPMFDAPSADFTDFDSWHPSGWSPVYDGTPWAFGLESFGPDEVALDIWFDAIVIANEPIGCLP